MYYVTKDIWLAETVNLDNCYNSLTHGRWTGIKNSGTRSVCKVLFLSFSLKVLTNSHSKASAAYHLIRITVVWTVRWSWPQEQFYSGGGHTHDDADHEQDDRQQSRCQHPPQPHHTGSAATVSILYIFHNFIFCYSQMTSTMHAVISGPFMQLGLINCCNLAPTSLGADTSSTYTKFATWQSALLVELANWLSIARANSDSLKPQMHWIGDVACSRRACASHVAVPSEFRSFNCPS